MCLNIFPLFPLAFLLLAPQTAYSIATEEPLQKTLRFSGYDWTVREQGVGGPGPNRWNPANVWVDTAGNLHLKLTHTKGKTWECAELTSKKKFGFGTYEFQTVYPVDRLDCNVVLGLFDYPDYGEGRDGTNEIDIEFARWGNQAFPNGNFTVYPAVGERGAKDSFTFEYAIPVASTGILATHRFIRTQSQVAFATWLGTEQGKRKRLGQWTYAPTEARLIPQKPLAVHLNLWLFAGKAPTNGQEVEIVVKKFTFTSHTSKPFSRRRISAHSLSAGDNGGSGGEL